MITLEQLKKAHGKRVTCRIDTTEITDAKININKNGKMYICQNEKDGGMAEDRLGYKYSWWFNPEKLISGESDVTNLRFLDRIIEDGVFEGDRLLNRSENEVEVLGICGKVIFLSTEKSFKKAKTFIYTLKELIDLGYTLKNEPEENSKKQELLTKADELIKKAEELKKQAESL